MDDGASLVKGLRGGEGAGIDVDLLSLEEITAVASASDAVDGEGVAPGGSVDCHLRLSDKGSAIGLEVVGLSELVGVVEEGIGEGLCVGGNGVGVALGGDGCGVEERRRDREDGRDGEDWEIREQSAPVDFGDDGELRQEVFPVDAWGDGGKLRQEVFPVEAGEFRQLGQKVIPIDVSARDRGERWNRRKVAREISAWEGEVAAWEREVAGDGIDGIGDGHG